MKTNGLAGLTYFGAPLSIYSVCQRYFRIFYGLSELTYPGAPSKIWCATAPSGEFFPSFSYLGDPRLLVQKDEELTGKGPCKNA